MLASCGGSGSSDIYSSAELANPASQNCIVTGGRLQFELAGDGAEYGVCVFEDNRQCEEWALYREECPRGGAKISGNETRAARYCVIRGGRYEVIQRATGSLKEQGLCTLPSGFRCDARGLFFGECP
jgi:putative hemolysin